MDLGQITLGALGVFFGLRTLTRGVETLGNGLKGSPRVERDPGMKGSRGRKVGEINRGPKGRVVLHEVRNLDERINAIRDRVRAGRVDPRVIAWARKQVTKRCPNKPGGWCTPEKHTVAEIAAIFYGMRRDVRYTSDVLGVDTYVKPGRTLDHRAGDCDDYSALGCASLNAIGIPCRLKVVRTKDSETWNHIYIQAPTSKHAPDSSRWISLDASVPAKPGWEVPASSVAESRVFEVG